MKTTYRSDLGVFLEKALDDGIDYILNLNWTFNLFYESKVVVNFYVRQPFQVTESKIPVSDQIIESVLDDSFIFYLSAFENVRKRNNTLYMLEELNEHIRLE